MTDFLFIDAGFSATQVHVEPVSDAGKVQFEDWFGRAAVSATLRKSSAYEMMTSLSAMGMTYEVKETKED